MQTSKSFVRTARRRLFLAGLLILPLGGKLVAYGQEAPQRPAGTVTALVIMTPTGSATCATWVQWRSPGAHSADKAAIEYWVEGYLSGLAAGSRHDFIAAFRREALAAWLDRYCTANPQTKLPLAVNALGREMLAHPGGQL